MKAQGPIYIKYFVYIPLITENGERTGTIRFPPYRTYDGALNKVKKIDLNAQKAVGMYAEIYYKLDNNSKEELLKTVYLFEIIKQGNKK